VPPRAVAIVGRGAVGAHIAKLIEGDGDFRLVAVHGRGFSPKAVVEGADIVVEAASPDVVKLLAPPVLAAGRILVPVSVAGLFLSPELLDNRTGRIVVPSGATGALDALGALAGETIIHAHVRLRLPGWAAPHGLPFVGPLTRAVELFPTHCNNMAATALALGRRDLEVELVLDETVAGPTIDLDVRSPTMLVACRIEHRCTPDHPDPSRNIALSVAAALRRLVRPLAVGS
jgi:aspartate dehydrogenase